MKRETVTYSTIIKVSDKWLSKNGRVKLLDVGKAVTATEKAALATGKFGLDYLKAQAEEVITSAVFDDEDDGLIDYTLTCVRITVTRDVPSLRHVRKSLLENTSEDLINDLPKTPYEDLVFAFFQLLGCELADGDPTMTDIYITMKHKNYVERTRLRLKTYYEITKTRNVREFRRWFKAFYSANAGRKLPFLLW